MLTVGAHCPAMVVVMGFDGVYMVLLVVVMDLFLRGKNLQNHNFSWQGGLYGFHCWCW